MTSRSVATVRPLDEVATIERDAVAAADISRGTLYVGLEHIDSDGNFVGVKAVDAGELASSKFRFGRDHILFGKLRPYLRKTARPDFEGICSTDIVPILPGPNVDRDYLFHYLRHPRVVEQAVLRCSGANLPRLSPRDLGRFDVPVPSLAEQRRIANILDKADAIRGKRNEAIGLMDELLRSAFLDMFGDPVTNPLNWPVRPLGELADIVSGVTKGKRYKNETLVSVPYMRVANVHDGHLVLDEIKTITVSKAEALRYELRQGDVLLTEGGDPDKLGRGAVWRGEIPSCIHQNHIFRVRSGPLLRPDFLSAVAGSERGKRYFLSAAKQTTGIASINLTQLKAFPVLVPPLDLQDEYLRRMTRIANVQQRFNIRGRESDTLFSALIARAFPGSLEVAC